MQLPHLDGWSLLGAFPVGDPDGVGSWLLTNKGDALLLEIPTGLTVERVQKELRATGTALRFVTASHDHADHLDQDAWSALKRAFPGAKFLQPSSRHNNGSCSDQRLEIGGEVLWLIVAPKHSRTDVVTVFRGVAMTGDIELGQLESVNREVPKRIKGSSMAWLAEFQDRAGYHVHTIVSAHLNDFRRGVHWPSLFAV